MTTNWNWTRRYILGQTSPPINNALKFRINTNWGKLLKAIQTGNVAETSRVVANLNATGGANNRRYPTMARLLTNPEARNFINAVRSGRPVPAKYLSAASIKQLRNTLAVNFPEAWANNPNANRLLNSAHNRLVNSLNRRNLQGIRAAARNILQYSSRRNARYPYTSTLIPGNWIHGIAQGASPNPNTMTNNSAAIRNAIRRNRMNSAGATGGGNAYTIANFNRAQRNRNTFNTYARAWFGVNTRDLRLAPWMISSFNPSSVAHGVSKRAKLIDLLEVLMGGSQSNNSGGANGSQSNNSGGGGYTIASFNRAPRNRNTFNTYALEWFGKSFRGQPLVPSMARYIHPNKGDQNTNSNNFKKRTALTGLFNELRSS